MSIENKIGSRLLSMLLFITLMFPVAIQFAHTLEGHEHTFSTEKGAHIYQDAHDCQICDFDFTPFQYSVTAYFEVLKPIMHSKDEPYFASLVVNIFKKSHKQLRAPPHTFIEIV